jgi:hypothetical protein
MAYHKFDETVDQFQEAGRTLVEDRRGVEAVTTKGDDPGIGLTVGLPLAVYAAASDKLPVWARVGFGLVAATTAMREKPAIKRKLAKLKNFLI